MKLNAFSLLYVALTINLFGSIWVIAKLREQDNLTFRANLRHDRRNDR